MRKRRDDYKETTYSQAVYIKFYLSPSKGKKIVFAPQTFLLRLVRRHMSMRVTSGFRTSGMLVVLRVVAVVVRPVAVVACHTNRRPLLFSLFLFSNRNSKRRSFLYLLYLHPRDLRFDLSRVGDGRGHDGRFNRGFARHRPYRVGAEGGK